MDDRADKMTLFASVGSVVSGLLGSLCCIGPLIFVILGLSGAAFFTQLEQYRLLFGIVALGFLAFGFFFVYRGEGKCAPGTSCAIIPGRRRLNKIILWIVTILLAVIIFSPNIIRFFIT